MPNYLRYRDDLEQVGADEKDTIAKLIDVMTKGQREVAEKQGETVRISHAKAHAFAKGELTVLPNLPPELAQGLFSEPGEYDVVVRMSQVPGEILDDRAVSSPRGMAIKVFGVEGPKLPGHENASTQDFVFETGKVFIASGLKSFLANFTQNAKLAPKLPEAVKGAVSKASEAANALLHEAGGDSPKLDVYGHPSYHPLAESYYSQIAFRYGDYVAKLAVVPANPALEELYLEHVEMNDPDAVRNATKAFFASHAAEYEVKVQLATDPERMPVEDPMVEWPEHESPYRTVARIVLPSQDSDAANLRTAVDYDLSFSPAHALAAHRPLGAIGRGRLAVYPVVSAARRSDNGRSISEPSTLAAVEGTTPLPRAPLAPLTRRRAPLDAATNGTSTRRIANGLGWFSLALGLTEVIAAEPLARALGIKKAGLIRAFGAREIAAGLGLLLQKKKGPWVWGRIAGDALDLGVLGSALSSNNRRRGNAALALVAVAPVVALDLLCGTRLGLSE